MGSMAHEDSKPTPPPAVVRPPSVVPPHHSTQAPLNLDDGPIAQIIPTKNIHALIAYYLGVFSLIPCFALLLGPAAAITGILGLRAIGRQPGLPGRVHAWIGIVLGGLTFLLNVVGITVFVLSLSRS